MGAGYNQNKDSYLIKQRINNKIIFIYKIKFLFHCVASMASYEMKKDFDFNFAFSF